MKPHDRKTGSRSINRSWRAGVVAGTTLHLIGVMLAGANGITSTHVPYRGGLPAAQDVVAGQIAASINVVSEQLPFHQAGKLRILAVSGATRSPLLPDVPTFAESGYKALESDVWFGAFVNGKSPDAATQQVATLVAEAAKSPEMHQTLTKLGFEMVGSTPAELARTIRPDHARWSETVRKSGYTADDS